jgi:hypothetical protein
MPMLPLVQEHDGSILSRNTEYAANPTRLPGRHVMIRSSAARKMHGRQAYRRLSAMSGKDAGRCQAMADLQAILPFFPQSLLPVSGSAPQI